MAYISIFYRAQNFIRVLAFTCVLTSISLLGQSKDTYTLFKPVPKDKMREMETDRPDVTESPYTVDAGHFQLETDLVRKTTDQSENEKTSTLLINQANIKIGILNRTAIQIGFQMYGSQKEKNIDGDSENSRGFGDITLRIKQNIIGDDNGNFAMAVIPYLKLPTSQFEESRCESGLIIPMIYKFPGDWNLGFQLEIDRLKDKDISQMHTELLQTLTLSHPIAKRLDVIAETYYTYDFKAHQLTNYLNAAVQVEVLHDFKLDAGVNYGLQHLSEKHFFLGASYRL